MKWFLIPTSSQEQHEQLQQWLEAEEYTAATLLEKDPRAEATQKIRQLIVGATVALLLLAGFGFWQMGETEKALEKQKILEQELLQREQVQRDLQDSLLLKEVELIEFKQKLEATDLVDEE